MRHFSGGLEDWTTHGLPLESSAPVSIRRGPAARRRERRRALSAGALADFVTARSVAGLLSLWLLMVVGCGLIYWAASVLDPHALLEGSRPVGPGAHALFAAIYFSFVTATSLGYGDLVPVGAIRLLAVGEGAAGLLLFGLLVSRLVSRRQEQLIEEIHHIAFGPHHGVNAVGTRFLPNRSDGQSQYLRILGMQPRE